MQTPDALRSRLRVAWSRNRHDWLQGGGSWPKSFSTEPPTEAEAMAHWSVFDGWLAQWRTVARATIGRVREETRVWQKSLGTQSLPCAWCFDTPADIAAALGEAAPWTRAKHRFDALVDRFEQGAESRWRQVIARDFDALADLDDKEYARICAVLDWLRGRPGSGIYPRQLPIAGIDSKWLDARRSMIAAWVAALRDIDAGDFHAVTGLRAPPDRLRMRLLDPALRRRLGGLTDIEAPIEEIASLEPGAGRVLIVENLYTGLAIEDRPGTVLFMGRGNAIEAFARIPWLKDLPIDYWGDLDTYGMAILARLRGYLPQVRSVLMDRGTLLAFEPLWGTEKRQHPSIELAHLTVGEREVYADLRGDALGTRIRLEQERIAWDWVCARL
jgi:hypothetical protein